jgi:hypothetical protein
MLILSLLGQLKSVNINIIIYIYNIYRYNNIYNIIDNNIMDMDNIIDTLFICYL